MIKFALSHLLLCITLSCFAQTNSEREKILEQRKRAIQEAFGENFFKDMDDFNLRYKKMMEEFFEGGLNQDFFNRSSIDQFMKKMRPHKQMDLGEAKWIETDDEKIQRMVKANKTTLTDKKVYYVTIYLK